LGKYHQQKTHNFGRVLLTESTRIFPGMKQPVKPPVDGTDMKFTEEQIIGILREQEAGAGHTALR